MLEEAAPSGRAVDSASAKIDAKYTAYDEHPLDEADEFGDLASFLGTARWPNVG
jgi:hypothetical protein